MQAVFGRNGEAPVPVIACSAPSDAFECAIEACRIATRYMTPVMLLSDGYIANGSEPWKLPELESLKPFPVEFHTDGVEFLPYARNEDNKRPWAIPGNAGTEHRVGGLERAHLTGNISYDPENHEFMVNLRNEKVMGIANSIPTPKVTGPEEADVLVLGWGSTLGAITGGVDRLIEDGKSVARAHLRHVWPLPNGLDEMFARYKAILVPEMNLGQMARILRSEFPHHNFISYPKVQGVPFLTSEIMEKVNSILES